MDVGISAQDHTGYLRGKARHWFWAAAAMAALTYFLHLREYALDEWVLGQVGYRTGSCDVTFTLPGLFLLLSGLRAFLYAAMWVMVPLAYGLNSRVKPFRIFLLTAAGAGAFNAMAYFFYLSNMGAFFTDHPFPEQLRRFIIYAGRFTFPLAWVILLTVIIASRRTGWVLRVASVILLISRVLVLFLLYEDEWFDAFRVVRAVGGDAFDFLVRIHSAVEGWYVGITSGYARIALDTAAIYLPLILFFGAMSFTRPKERERVQSIAA